MRQLGDAAVLLDVDGGHRACQALARTIRARDVIPGATTVGVIGPAERLEASPPPRPPEVHEVAIAFDGEDVAPLGLTRDGLERELGGSELEVAFLGFMPGFAYLVGLPAALAALPRQASPRTRVPAGSFAVAGGYAGIYPVGSPGGWNLLGHTNVRCFNPEQQPYALFQPGDRVRLVPTRFLELGARATRHPLEGTGLEVLDPGPLLLVEDLGREGVGALGVPRAGAANACFLRIANLAVGNDEGAAALELTGATRLRAERDLLVALAGDAPLAVDGTLLAPGTVAAAGAGQEIAIGPVRHGARALLAVGGGLITTEYFGSRSGDGVSGLPPGPLRVGDHLQIGSVPPRARLRFVLPEAGTPVRLRAIEGPDDVDGRALEGSWVADVRSDRTGVRLHRGDPEAARQASSAPGTTVPSHAVVPGAIQLPPGGEPVILGPDCGPVGGYPVAATVITADLWRIGTLAPGDLVEIDIVSLAYAGVAGARLEQLIGEATSGWYPTTVA
ncbi:MAG: carboxyltransferase domain-containing protein [Acidimicrobiales bacterium]|jgi:biotin-dependent carboxylase-like uncharacterized protein